MRSAINTTGYLLWMGDRYIFRVYQPDRKYIDYELKAEDIKVTIATNYVSLCDETKELKFTKGNNHALPN